MAINKLLPKVPSDLKMANVGKIQRQATKLRSQLNQLVMDTEGKYPILKLEVRCVYMHQNGVKTGRVRVNGMNYHCEFSQKKQAWIFDSRKVIK